MAMLPFEGLIPVLDWLSYLVINKIYQSPFLLSLYKLYKLILRLATNSTEISRLCSSAVARVVYDQHWEKDADSQDSDEKEALNESVPQKQIRTVQVNKGLNQLISNVQNGVTADILYRIDRSILYSKQLAIERRELELSTFRLDQVSQAILLKKQFPSGGAKDTPEAKVLQYCLQRIAETHRLVAEINTRTHTKYDSNNKAHEAKLMELWQSLMVDTPLEGRITRQWGQIGFQGSDPATDFRGMGMQGLDDLLYYAKTHPDSARRTLQCSLHPVSWYPFAIVGINITQFAVQILLTRKLQYYLFQYGSTREMYSEFYCYLFHSFNEFWMSHEQPRLTVMEFESKFKEFKLLVEQDLLVRKITTLKAFLGKTNTTLVEDITPPMDEKKQM
ncbi:ELMO/CED-12 family-domain-containing protein [Umbelopsis sp. PMI_123]|nr:ELMO/CED-12 family-domain-containing protein [Umbelopsis sp. PMI_123]